METRQRKRRRPDIAEQHRELRGMVQEIEDTGDIGRLVSLLQALRRELQQHFADEEREDGGLAEAVGASAPRHLRRLDGLFREHTQLLATTDQLIARGQALLDGMVQDVLRDARDLCGKLRQHEAQETELLTDAVLADIGGG
jgi:Hemerythrin HHE cation binding domain